jgi:hypothetical protein
MAIVGSGCQREKRRESDDTENTKAAVQKKLALALIHGSSLLLP